MNGDMVQAYLDGRKTQTRRTYGLEKINEHPDWFSVAHEDGGGNWVFWYPGNQPGLAEFTKRQYPNGEGIKCPYGKPGDILWWRETWAAHSFMNGTKPRDIPKEGPFIYRADPSINESHYWWRPSIHMPRWACRITTQILSVTPMRVQDMTYSDCQAEGIETNEWITWREDAFSVGRPDGSHIESLQEHYAYLWDSIYGKRYSWWNMNPWAWKITFPRKEE
jgi:hypothetical protein